MASNAASENQTNASASVAVGKPKQVKLVLLGRTKLSSRLHCLLIHLYLGESAVGKSSLVQRFVNREYVENREPTIGGKKCKLHAFTPYRPIFSSAAFLTQKCTFEDRTIKFEIWDTAGQERFHSLAPMYYRNSQAAIVVYDITKSVK